MSVAADTIILTIYSPHILIFYSKQQILCNSDKTNMLLSFKIWHQDFNTLPVIPHMRSLGAFS